MAATKKEKIYEFQDIHEFSEVFEEGARYGSVDEVVDFAVIQNQYNEMVARGCKPDTISLWVKVRADSFGDPVLTLTWQGLRTENQTEYAARVEGYERRSASAKAAISKRREKELAKAKKEIEEAQKTIEKLTEKFGISILTD